jgi:hypothetical protein
MSDLVKFSIPAAFVIERAVLTPGELSYGHRHGWLSDADVVRVALAGYGVLDEMPQAYEELALLLSDDVGRVPDLVRELEPGDEGESSTIWCYLALSSVFERKSEYDDPLQVVEMIYADFGYPEEIEGFVRYMPVADGDPVGEQAIYDRWRAYLRAKDAEYRARFKE